MAENTSVGSVQLDVEISPNSINTEMVNMGKYINTSFKSMFNGIGNQANSFIKGSLHKMNGDIKSFSQIGSQANDKVSQSISKMNSQYEKTEGKIKELQKELSKLYAEQNKMVTDLGVGNLPITKEESIEILTNYPQYNKLTEQISALTAKMDPLINKNKELKAEIQNVGNGAQETGSKLRLMGQNTDKAGKNVEKASLKTRLFGDEMKRTGVKSAGFAAMINKSFMTIMKRLFVYNLIMKGIRGVMNYMGAALSTNSQFVNSLNTIKTNLMVAFQPIYDFVLPALNALMSAVATVTTYIASAISALFGKSYEQSHSAAKGMNAVAKSMGGAGKAAGGAGKAAKKAGKEAKGALMGFDEINQLDVKDNTDSDSGGGGGGAGGGFEMGMPDMATIDMTGINKFKEIMSKMFEPFKNAWDNEGQATIDAMKYALNSIWGLNKAIGKSWLDVWTNGTGQTMLENMLIITQNLFNIVGNLAEAFRNAWEQNEVGTRIIQGIFDLLNIVLSTIRDITGATAVWAETLDFSPLLESISSLLEALKPLTQNIGDGLVWLWENALLPIAGWVIEDAVPVFLEILAEGITVLNNVIEPLKPLAKWLLESFLLPLAEWTGGVIVSVLGKVRDALGSIGDWIANHKALVEDMAIVVASFMTAWGIVNLVKTIGGIVGALVTFITTGGLATAVSTALAGAIAFLTSPITLTIASIGALIAAGVLLYKHWDVVKDYATKTWDGIKNVFSTFENWLINSFSRNWSREFGLLGDVVNAFFKNASNILDGVKQVFQGLMDFLKGAFTGDWKRMWQGLADIMKGITSTFVAIMKAPLNGVIGLMNGAISGLNKIKVPDWVPGVGGKGVNIAKIPMLARGGIIDQPTLAMVGERGKEAVMPLENNTGWITDLASQIVGIMGTGQGSGDTTIIVKVGEDTLVDKVVSGVNRENRINGKTIITV